MIDKVVLLMVTGLSPEDLKTACIAKLSIPTEEVDAVINEARRRITVAADYNRDEQLGTAISRLNDIYSRSIRGKDIKTALTAQRELNKLMDLYREATSDPLASL